MKILNKILILSTLACSSLFALNPLDREIVAEEIEVYNNSLPGAYDTGMILTKVELNDLGVLTYNVEIKQDILEKSADIVINKDTISKLRQIVLPKYKMLQLKNLCLTTDSKNLISKGFSFNYHYTFDSGLVLGDTLIDLETCEKTFRLRN